MSKIPGFRSGKVWKKVVAVIGYLFILFIAFAIYAVVSTPTKTTTAPVTKVPVIDQKAIDTDNVKLKAEAVKANFIEINGHYDKVKAKAVFAKGEISVPKNDFKDGLPSFTLSQPEGSGFGMYRVLNGSGIYDLKEGETVTVYGKVTEPDATGMPTIMGTVVERIVSVAPTPVPTPIPVPAPTNKPTMTMAEFTQLKTGMTYEEATKIIGGPGEVMSESGSIGDPAHTVMYTYKGEGDLGANANLMFQGDKLMNKAQFGLK